MTSNDFSEKQLEEKETSITFQILSFCVGFLISILLSNIIIYILNGLEFYNDYLPVVKKSIEWGVIITAVGVIWKGGFVNIPKGHRGVIEIVGRPIDTWLLARGQYWLLPRPLMNVIIIDTKKSITKTFAITVYSSETIPTTIQVSAGWRKNNPYKTIDVDDDVYNKISMESGLKKMVTAAIINTINNNSLSYDEFPKVSEDILRDIKIKANEKFKEYGSEVIEIYAELVTLPSDLQSALTQKMIAVANKATRLIDAAAIAQELNAFINSANLTPTEAKNMLLNLEGKLQSQEIIFSGGNNNLLMQALYLLSSKL